MDLAGIVGLLVGVVTLLGTVVSVPWLIQRKLDEKIGSAVEHATKDFVTELHLVKGYVPKSDYDKTNHRIERELQWQRRVLLAIARAMKVDVDEPPDD